MFSAFVMSFATSFLSGTKIQATSPTGPMTATYIAIASQIPDISSLGITHLQFINFSILLSGIILIICGICKFDTYIKFIPNIIVSGFMTGIAILIFTKELNFLFGFGKTGNQIQGDTTLNIMVVLAVVIFAFLIPLLYKFKWKFQKHINTIPPTLIVILLATILTYTIGIASKIELVEINLNNITVSSIFTLFHNQFPPELSYKLLIYALPIAIEFAAIAYLDTLMTALIIEQKTAVKANHKRDLYAQGISNGIISSFGGLPGAQSTVPSMMLLHDGATGRLATVSMALFTGIGIFLFSDLMSFIPQAVFVGILIKIAYDVADPRPFMLFFQQKGISIKQVITILTIALLTAFWNLNAAIIGSTLLFILYKKFFKTPLVKDLKFNEETEGYEDEM